MAIVTTKRDVLWNYAGTITSMTSGFLLLPLLLAFLSPDELGLWYTFVAVSNLAQLFEFGFNPTFARNIVYCMSGARRLAKTGCDFSSVREGVDWHLLKTLFRASGAIYALIASMMLALLVSVGTLYVSTITAGLEGTGHWVFWAIFCAAIFLNLYYLRYVTFLRGVGDVAGENRAKTFAKLIQLGLSAALLAAGAGLVGASVGYLANGLLLRVFARRCISRHADVSKGLASDTDKVTWAEMKEVFSTISTLAWRDGIVQIALFACTQATSIMASLFLGLAETGTYSMMLQLGNAVSNFASAYANSFFPAFQSSFSESNRGRMREIVERSISAYWSLGLFGAAGVVLVIFPLLTLVKPDTVLSVPLFLALSGYYLILNHYSIFCNYIISMNQIPYMPAYLISSSLGAGLCCVLTAWAGLGAWGLVLGQAIPQLAYNAWYWPHFIMRELGESYLSSLSSGFGWWRNKVLALVSK